MKKCTKCNKYLKLQDFHKAKNLKDGRHTICKFCKKVHNSMYHEKNKESINSKKRKKYCPENKHEYYQNNKKQIKTRTKQYKADRYKNDLEFKIRDLLSSGTRRLLKGKAKKNSSLYYLGCSIDEFKIYIESKFVDGMTWENWTRDGWHLDHIIPISSFNLLNEDEIKKACHYTNFQPLWSIDNKSKGAKMPHELD